MEKVVAYPHPVEEVFVFASAFVFVFDFVFVFAFDFELICVGLQLYWSRWLVGVTVRGVASPPTVGEISVFWFVFASAFVYAFDFAFVFDFIFVFAFVFFLIYV